MQKMLFVVTSMAVLSLTPTSAIAEKFTAERSERGVVVKIDGDLFTEYLTRSGESPALWPIIGPTGKAMTRSYPVGPKVEGETTDHPHHHSLWFTHDRVSGADYWSGNGKGKGDKGPHIAHREFVEVEGGDTARITTRNDWMNGDKRICEDERTIECGERANGDRWIDFTITLKATDADVTFGDTKEGTFAIRVADTMRVEAKQGGRIVNSDGKVDGDAWGLPAKWVDYTGPVKGETLGVAMLSHPTGFRPVPRWHVRTYGLFTANPFGQHDFPQPEASQQGAVTIKKGDSLTLRYRVLFHRGLTKEAEIDNAFDEFAAD